VRGAEQSKNVCSHDARSLERILSTWDDRSGVSLASGRRWSPAFCVLLSALAVTPFSAAHLSESDSLLSASGGLWGCAYSTHGKLLGCLPSAFSCRNLFDLRRGRWVFITEEYAPKELNTPPTVAAKHVRPGLWRIVAWPSRRFRGRAISTNAEKTRWRITNRQGDYVYAAEGADGALVAMLMLTWGRDAFC
jgi:hypothetical protein